MWPYSKKFKDLKTFEDYLQHKKESSKIDAPFFVGMVVLAIIAAYFVGFTAGMLENIGDAEEIVCSAVGMEMVPENYVNKFCVDSNGTFHRVVVTDGKVYIDK